MSSEEKFAIEMAKEFKSMFTVMFDQHTEVMLASLILTTRRMTLEEIAQGILLVKDTDAFHTSTNEEIVDGLSQYILALAGATQVRQ